MSNKCLSFSQFFVDFAVIPLLSILTILKTTMNDDFSKKGLNLRHDLLKGLRNSTQADFKIICKDGLIVRASSHLLSMRSDWFHFALNSGLKESIRKEIV